MQAAASCMSAVRSVSLSASLLAGFRSSVASSAVRPGPLTNVRFSQRRCQSSKPDISGYNSKVLAVLGAQWGDEGKGKLVDVLAKHYDIIARFNGGSNAGHTLVVDGKKFAFHLLPCGMLYAGKLNVIGNGVVLHVPTLLKELEKLKDAGVDTRNRLVISNRAHLLFDAHQLVDGKHETSLKGDSIGTTKKGIGPCYATKIIRNGVRVGELVDFASFKSKHETLIKWLQSAYGGFEYNIAEEIERYRQYAEILKPMLRDTTVLLNQGLQQGKTILAEGANAALLDIDHGTYPYVTSSSTAAGGICTGLGIAPSKVETTIGVVKAYTTRVGAGPFPTELNDQTGEALRAKGHEFGTTTGRPRRCGWLDIPVVQYSALLNNYASINITKLDVLSDLEEVKIGVAYKINRQRVPAGYMPSTLAELGQVEVEYETMKGWKCDISKVQSYDDLPAAAKNYLNRVEQLLGMPISWVGVGPGRTAMVTKGFAAKY